MMLTMPILILCWALAIGSAAVGCFYIRARPIVGSLVSYLGIGFFALAVPMKIAMHATSVIGMLFLTLVWPVWMAQGLFNYKVTEWFPDAFWALMFNF